MQFPLAARPSWPGRQHARKAQLPKQRARPAPSPAAHTRRRTYMYTCGIIVEGVGWVCAVGRTANPPNPKKNSGLCRPVKQPYRPQKLRWRPVEHLD